MKRCFWLLVCFCWQMGTGWALEPVFSTAGFYELANSGRKVYNMNPAWRFLKGDAPEAWQVDFDDSDWQKVSLPHGLEYLPTEASGCINYQGKAWYRKHFNLEPQMEGKRLYLHFEAIMGKSKVWVNGQLATEHFGGYLPVVIDATELLKPGESNVIAVCADNSNDPLYPPGKPQETLDFTYFGGIYRDCFLIAHHPVYITDPNAEQEVAGGGLFVSFDQVSEQSANVNLKLHLRNRTDRSFRGKIHYILQDTAGRKVKSLSHRVSLPAGQAESFSDGLQLKQPQLWSPEDPALYWLSVTLTDASGKVVDGYRKRIGIRSIEFRGKGGFWLNGKPYPHPLIGANRHQDFAIVGNALPNSIHWRDAKKLRDAGLKVIRNAHCPQDPAFMDACDELGLLVIVNTPGWQFWNDDPVFGQRVYEDIRNLVRRDRNHPSVWLWEPILNETWYPADFAKNVRDIVEEEYPYPYCYSACDAGARGKEYFKVLFAHPQTGDKDWALSALQDSITYFTREWGDNVDDWYAHNSPSRVYRGWGEVPMLVQAKHYAAPAYQYTSYETLYRTTRQHVGGCLWHSFDHQRGYHPDPFYGGLMDVFRQPKYSYYMFMSQRDPKPANSIAETGPMVFIAHEMTPFSPEDVTVYSNCDEVRLTAFKGGKVYTYHKEKREKGMPSPLIVFPGVYDFMKDKEMSRAQKQADVYLLAEGLIDGKVVAVDKRMPARRPVKIVLWLDNEDVSLRADGSDFVTVVAAIADQNGNIKRLNNDEIRFTVSGEGSIVGDESGFANPRRVEWGTAPVLIRSTRRPGKITVHAQVFVKGSQKPLDGEISFESIRPDLPFIVDENDVQERAATESRSSEGQEVRCRELEKKVEQLQQELNRMRLKEVGKQQEEFE